MADTPVMPQSPMMQAQMQGSQQPQHQQHREQPRSDASSKPRVLLSVLKCACFEHLEGETLFTAICAGFGRFECDRLLKPSGVELMNLPRSANIEISVLRRVPTDAERPKQLLYHGLISLNQVYPAFAAGGEAGSDAGRGEPEVWESWLGLFSSDVNLQAQSPDRLFQRCQEMGTSGARFPRLLVKLQYMPPGVSAVPSGRSAGTSRSALPHPQPSPTPAPPAVDRQHWGASASQAAYTAPTTAGPQDSFNFLLPGTSSAAHAPTGMLASTSGGSGPGPMAQNTSSRSFAEDLRDKVTFLESEVNRLRERELAWQAVDRDFWKKVGPSLASLGHNMNREASSPSSSPREARARWDEIAVALGEATRAGSGGHRGWSSGGGLSQKASPPSTSSSSTSPVAVLSLAAEAVSRALDTGEEGLEAWLADIADSRQAGGGEEDRRALLRSHERFVACCHRVAAARGGHVGGRGLAEARGEAEGPGHGAGKLFYKPLRDDPVDCLLASSLLRQALDNGGSVASFERLGSGMYRFGGAHGTRLMCSAEGGKLLLQRCAETEKPGEEPQAQGPAMELREFLLSQVGISVTAASAA